MPDWQFRTGEISLRYRDEGEGPAVVFLHHPDEEDGQVARDAEWPERLLAERIPGDDRRGRAQRRVRVQYARRQALEEQRLVGGDAEVPQGALRFDARAAFRPPRFRALGRDAGRARRCRRTRGAARSPAGRARGGALTPEFQEYQRQIVANAQALAEAMIGQGFRLVSGGTDTHVMLVDVAVKGLTGKAAEVSLDKAGLTVNKNAIPFDTKPPTITSGIRLGTPAITTRGMREAEMRTVAALIAEVLVDVEDGERQARVAGKVRELCSACPLYPEQLAS